MLLVAIGCIGAGTWQIQRFEFKVHANDALRGNAHAKAAPIADVLPLFGVGPAPSSRKYQYRSVTATGTYDTAHETLVRDRTIDVSSDDDGDNLTATGYLVLTPLVTPTGDLLVVRGFLSSNSNAGDPALPPAPTGVVTIKARAQPGESRHDDASELPDSQVESINPGEQQASIGRPVYGGYAQLESGQPGMGNLIAIPAPDLSNPAGGAVEPQHFAYIIQWYLFALLALAAPFAMVRAEQRRPPDRDLGTPAAPPEPQPAPEQDRAAKLADRYGRAVG
jgi:cytochrome oxidase assembly protein ShyY1